MKIITAGLAFSRYKKHVLISSRSVELNLSFSGICEFSKYIFTIQQNHFYSVEEVLKINNRKWAVEASWFQVSPLLFTCASIFPAKRY